MLATSVSPDNPQMKQVINFLNEIYGEHDKDTDSGLNYIWPRCDESNSTSTSVRLRRIHTDAGGPFLFLDSY